LTSCEEEKVCDKVLTIIVGAAGGALFCRPRPAHSSLSVSYIKDHDDDDDDDVSQTPARFEQKKPEAYRVLSK